MTIKDCKLLVELQQIHMCKCLENMQNRATKLSKYKVINFDDYINENKTEHNSKQPYISDHPYRKFIYGGSGSANKDTFLNLINNYPDTDKIYLYVKDPCEAKYQYLINKREKVGVKQYDYSEVFQQINAQY